MSDGMDEVEKLMEEKKRVDREMERTYVEILRVYLEDLGLLTKMMGRSMQELQRYVSEFKQFEEEKKLGSKLDLSIVENQLPSLELAINVAETSVKILEEYANSLRRRLEKEGE